MAAETPLFRVEFPDNSVFILPHVWSEVFLQYYGEQSAYEDLADRLTFITGKYVEHRVWPTKFDGIIQEDQGVTGDEKYDLEDFYFEHWDEPKSREKRNFQGDAPTWSMIAESVLYQSMRFGIMQQALKDMGSDARVVTPEEILDELEGKKKL